jgi:DNA polymerase-3 subunit beta
MDFYITKEEVVKSLNYTLGVVEKRQTLPILSNVLLEVDESSLNSQQLILKVKYQQLLLYQTTKVGVKQQPQLEN